MIDTSNLKNPFVEKIKLHAINSWRRFTDWAYHDAVQSMFDFAERMGADSKGEAVPPKSDLEPAFAILPIEWQIGMFLKFFDNNDIMISWSFDSATNRFAWKINKAQEQAPMFVVSIEQFDTRPEAIKDSIIEAFKMFEKELTAEMAKEQAN